jgi:hypothetical protein
VAAAFEPAHAEPESFELEIESVEPESWELERGAEQAEPGPAPAEPQPQSAPASPSASAKPPALHPRRSSSLPPSLGVAAASDSLAPRVSALGARPGGPFPGRSYRSEVLWLGVAVAVAVVSGAGLAWVVDGRTQLGAPPAAAAAPAARPHVAEAEGPVLSVAAAPVPVATPVPDAAGVPAPAADPPPLLAPVPSAPAPVVAESKTASGEVTASARRRARRRALREETQVAAPTATPSPAPSAVPPAPPPERRQRPTMADLLDTRE